MLNRLLTQAVQTSSGYILTCSSVTVLVPTRVNDMRIVLTAAAQKTDVALPWLFSRVIGKDELQTKAMSPVTP